YDIAIPVLLALAMLGLGSLLNHVAPALGTSGMQMLVWGFFVSTVVLFHMSVSINSLAHRFGTRRFDTRDDSRNNALLALITFGEGWHNNHHFFPGTARQGFRWWEIDITWYGLCLLERLGLVRDLKPLPAWVLEKADQ
ncbi:MAG TPA: acyl-CoA desaturase, partial [Rhodanobacteraceae bacterium]|nr:acyl-CoA desaturase [Rhodanobacteraceae bacterium]